MALDWLYGPRTQGATNMIQIRSLTIDLDVIRDVHAKIASHTGLNPHVSAQSRAGTAQTLGGGSVPLTDLPTLDDWELGTLMITSEDSSFTVDLRRGQQPTIIYNNAGFADLATSVAEILLQSGRPRVQWRRILPALPGLLYPALIGAWVWYLVAATPSPAVSFMVVGSLLVALGCSSIFELSLKMRQKYLYPWPGHRIRATTRSEVRNRRADRHANLKLSAVTIPAGAVIGAIVTLLIRR